MDNALVHMPVVVPICCLTEAAVLIKSNFCKVEAWLAKKAAEALRSPKLLLEEEEAARERSSHGKESIS
ncbi:LRR receptor-like serine/threonine-protein kinase ERECTA [Iris pallida]|uniref:LRR receptor-like serine/threonine-protein kinase ERECTA n=1 Tax=Iris pallida TaxID=29817 RepID=A0AAX6GVR2_IRIPA|nr:LRR receptor-like serine/threonine-protein kinase ERECTA [Iris pallida]